jgi:hypothetical protein
LAATEEAAARALLPQDLGTLGQVGIIHQDGASFPTGHVLRLVEAEGAERAHPAQRAVPVASACVFAVGWLAYLALLGSVGPGDMLRPTVDFLRDNETQAAPYVQPVSTWVLHLPRIWAPVALSLALVVVLRGALLGSGLPARIAQLCIGDTAFAWLFQFTVTSSFIETWWSY